MALQRSHERHTHAAKTATSTGFIALLAPLVRAGLLPADWPYSCNAVSGYSGGGKSMIEAYEAGKAPAFELYGLGFEHKHVPELQLHARLARRPIFVPSVERLPSLTMPISPARRSTSRNNGLNAAR